MRPVNMEDYDYELPDDRIAQHPVKERDGSKLLIYDGDSVSSDLFRNMGRYISAGSLLVFNNTRVIRARLLFRKSSGAEIEIFCLEPLSPAGYDQSFASGDSVEWKCIIGNLKKWKTGGLKMKFISKDRESELRAEKISGEGEAWRIRFSWEDSSMNFGEVIEACGHIPLPPYIHREDEKEDYKRYQTIYSAVKGSVAAPTAGLHFTEEMIGRLNDAGIRMANITLHVGAGTFQPVRAKDISGHEMHTEHFFVTNDTISILIKNEGRIIPVGTTTVRTLESLYWLGVKLREDNDPDMDNLKIEQWEPYRKPECGISFRESMEIIHRKMKDCGRSFIHASTRIIIMPGYIFRAADGIITNFHQPRSTLLLLIAAFTGNSWRSIYNYALDNGFRFLSYGDSSLLLGSHNPNTISRF